MVNDTCASNPLLLHVLKVLCCILKGIMNGLNANTYKTYEK